MAEKRLTVTGPLKEAVDAVWEAGKYHGQMHGDAIHGIDDDGCEYEREAPHEAKRKRDTAEQALLRLLDEMMAEAVHRGGRHTDMLTEQRLGREVSGIREGETTLRRGR